MATKNDPGPYDCYSKLEPDEPYFLVKATDPLAPRVTRIWAMMAEQGGTSREKVKEAMQVAGEMERWREAKLNEQQEKAVGTEVQGSAEPTGRIEPWQ